MLNEKVIGAFIGLIVIGIVTTMFAGGVLNNRKFSENRAYKTANKFLKENNIKTKRITCAGDSNQDGYGTCNVVTTTGEKITLNCPTDFGDVVLWGATGCKEVFMNMNMMMPAGAGTDAGTGTGIGTGIGAGHGTTGK